MISNKPSGRSTDPLIAREIKRLWTAQSRPDDLKKTFSCFARFFGLSITTIHVIVDPAYHRHRRDSINKARKRLN